MALDGDRMSFNGTVQIPGSKSLTHRALILASHSLTPCTVVNGLESLDTAATAAGLGKTRVDCHNSGTTLRLMLGQAAIGSQQVQFSGDASLSVRPNGPLLAELAGAGCTITGGPTLPISVSGPAKASKFTLPARTSSQFGSSILLMAPFLTADSSLAMDEPVSSSPYLDLTVAMMQSVGLDVSSTGSKFLVPGNQTFAAAEIIVEGDWSTAAFPAVAAAITGGTVTLSGLNMDSAQGDKAILGFLEQFGCTISGTTITGGTLTSPGTVDVAQTPDAFPALCILAAASEGTTTFTGGHSLRAKESDRISAMVTGLRAMGCDAQETPEGAIIAGSPLVGAHITSHGDHRIHMAFRVASLIAKGLTTIDHPDCVAVSYPAFHADFARCK
jgi:3-phosphoshikimate 1-carboxyvinyltransferase